MREACYKYLAHMMVRGPGGTADPGEPLKQATGTVLGILGEALQMQVLVGSGSTTAHELTEGHSSSGPCWRDARICILSHDSHFNLAWE